jgi:predicted dehydrogenase
VTRRDVVKSSVVAASALAGVTLPAVHAGENNTIDVALIGCGGRGTGAAKNALATTSGPIRLTAMADAYADRLSNSYASLKREVKEEERLQVKDEQKFVGFDTYKKAMDCLKPGDVAVMATPPAFRWPMFQYAIQKGLNVFMEKPVTVDGPTSRKMLELAEQSEKKNLKVGVGLMCRHCAVRAELLDRIKQGEIGDILLLRAYRMAGPTATAFAPKRNPSQNELEYQIRNFHGFLWASGGAFSDFLIHNIDECCWMKGDWPVKAQGAGGRHYRDNPRGGEYVDQNFDTYAVEYTFKDGTKLLLEGRTMTGARSEFASYVHGSKAAGVISASGHSPARCKIYKNQVMNNDNIAWAYRNRREPDPYQLEWDHLVQAIRDDKPFNEAKRGTIASLVTSMGRLASHSAQEITYEQMLNHTHEFAPTVDQLSVDGPAPVVADKDGRYPVPQPGKLRISLPSGGYEYREYEEKKA